MTAETGDSAAFDAEALYVRLDKRRRQDRISWREVGRQAGIRGPSWANRLGRDGNLSVDNLAKALVWLGDTDIVYYLRRSEDG